MVPFKRVVTQMVDNFESRVRTLEGKELELAGRVLQVSSGSRSDLTVEAQVGQLLLKVISRP